MNKITSEVFPMEQIHCDLHVLSHLIHVNIQKSCERDTIISLVFPIKKLHISGLQRLA